MEPCRTVATFLLDTGLRISECVRLTWDRVVTVDDDPELYGYLQVVRSKSKKSERYIPLTRTAREIIDRQRQLSRSQFVFVRHGERVDKHLWYVAPLSRHTVSEQFSRRRDEMGLPKDAVLHSTRHTAGTDLAASGANAFTIQAFMGHADIRTSARYIHPVERTLLESLQRMTANREKEAQQRRPALAIVATAGK